MTDFSKRVYSIGTLAQAEPVNAWGEANSFGPNVMGPGYVPLAGADDAEATHKVSNAQLLPDGPGGVEQLRALFGASGILFAVVAQGGLELGETNVEALEGQIGEPLAFDAFATACGLKRRVVELGI